MHRPGRTAQPIPPQHLEAALELWGQSTGKRLIPVTGRSMLPTLNAGDLLLLAAGSRRVRSGDIVVFRSGTGLVSHRVLTARQEASGWVYLTKGDNLFSLDAPVPSTGVMGVARAVIRGGRYLAIDTPAWRLANACIAGLMLAEARLYDLGRRAADGTPARGTWRLTGRLPARLLALLFRLALRSIQAASGRWRAIPPPQPE